MNLRPLRPEQDHTLLRGHELSNSPAPTSAGECQLAHSFASSIASPGVPLANPLAGTPHVEQDGCSFELPDLNLRPVWSRPPSPRAAGSNRQLVNPTDGLSLFFRERSVRSVRSVRRDESSLVRPGAVVGHSFGHSFGPSRRVSAALGTVSSLNRSAGIRPCNANPGFAVEPNTRLVGGSSHVRPPAS